MDIFKIFNLKKRAKTFFDTILLVFPLLPLLPLPAPPSWYCMDGAGILFFYVFEVNLMNDLSKEIL